MKIIEIYAKSSDVVYENEDYSDIASIAISDPITDELGSQNKERKRGQSRKPLISLRHIHKLKLIQLAKREEHEKRKSLMGLCFFFFLFSCEDKSAIGCDFRLIVATVKF